MPSAFTTEATLFDQTLQTPPSAHLTPRQFGPPRSDPSGPARGAPPSPLKARATPQTSSALLLPTLLIAGVTHAGVRALATDLGQHPQVCLPDQMRIDRYAPMRFGRSIEVSLEAYERSFARWQQQRYRVEVAPIYFDGGPDLVARVAADLPETRVLMLLRDPTRRLWDAYRYKRDHDRLPRAMSFEGYLERCLVLRANGADRFESNRYFRALGSGVYDEHLALWAQAFPERVLVIFDEDLRRPAAIMNLLYRWLGLDPEEAAAGAESIGTKLDAARFRSRWLQTFEAPLAAPLAATASGPRPGWSSRPAVDLGPPQRRATSHMPDRARRRVEEFYAGANARLAQYLRTAGYRDLPDWLTWA